MVELEQRPKDPGLLASIFVTIRTIKGICGFLGFTALEGLTHVTENILSQLRDGKRELTPDLVTLILESVDLVKAVLVSIEATGNEGADTHGELHNRLQAVSANVNGGESPERLTGAASPN